VVSLRNQKIDLRLIIFLRTAIQQSKDSDFSLVQQEQMGKLVVEFLAIYKHARGNEMIQFARKIEETFHVNILDESIG
jgi:hypothetical protein